ncbi:MAG TPA: hypothetical protein VKV28_12630 [Candidatus Binataceae bacterium]|nr:hypothetical protein [Candidatus Binataceae bacterium]
MDQLLVGWLYGTLAGVVLLVAIMAAVGISLARRGKPPPSAGKPVHKVRTVVYRRHP